MTREKLPWVRHGITMPVVLKNPDGSDRYKFDVTFNLDDSGAVKECFMRQTKEGNDFSSVMIDGCIAISLLLQHGETMATLAGSFGENRIEGEPSGPPMSALGAIVRAGAELEEISKQELGEVPWA